MSAKRQATANTESRDRLIDKALKEVNPPAERREECREQLIYDIEFLAKHTCQGPGFRDIHDDYATLAKRAASLRQIIRKISRYNRGILPEDFLKALDAVADIKKLPPVPRSGGKRDWRKVFAAEQALMFFLEFGTKPPTLTVGGAYTRFTNIFYEAGTGLSVDLSAQCRAAFHNERVWQGTFFGPIYFLTAAKQHQINLPVEQ